MASFAKPHPVCIDVVTATRCLTDVKFSERYAKKGVSKWDKNQQFLKDKNCIQKMVDVVPERIQFHQAANADKLLGDKTTDQVRCISLAAAGFTDWAQKVVEAYKSYHGIGNLHEVSQKVQEEEEEVKQEPSTPVEEPAPAEEQTEDLGSEHLNMRRARLMQIKSSDITELKSMKSPPERVSCVLAAVKILSDKKFAKHFKRSGKKDWNLIKKDLSDQHYKANLNNLNVSSLS